MRHEPLAQLAEHLTFNQGARGSNPRWLTKERTPIKRVLKRFFGAFFYPFLGFDTSVKVRKKH